LRPTWRCRCIWKRRTAPRARPDESSCREAASARLVDMLSKNPAIPCYPEG
jgi:hypothetical protein